MKFFFILFILIPFICQAQIIPAPVFVNPNLSDQSDFEYDSVNTISIDKAARDSLNPKKYLYIPLAETIGSNLGLWSFNKFVTGAEYANINWNTIKNNFSSGFGWDADDLLTNQFGHPYQGSMYYNSARSLGYNYTESMTVTGMGSLMWEFFMESESPAINDFIATTLSGAMLGEMLYRMSSRIIDESVVGKERVLRECLATILNPFRALNRSFYKRTTRNHTKNIYKREPRNGELSLGMNNVADGTNLINGTRNLMLKFDYFYGQAFHGGKHKPFDYFNFRFALNFWEQEPIGYVYSHGFLFGKELTLKHNQKLLTGIFQHYDYISNNIYTIGATSLGWGIVYRFPAVNDAELLSEMHISVILMGGANSAYAEEYLVPGVTSYPYRDYNMGTGLNSKFEGTLSFPWGSLHLGYLGYWIHTLDGAPGDEFIGIFKPKFTYRIMGPWNIGLEYLFYQRQGKYADYPDVNLLNNEQRLFLSWKF